MQLEVQWFIAALVSEELMTKEDCLEVMGSVGENADIAVVAQEALNVASMEVSETDAEALLEPFEQIAEYAIEQAEKGETPPECYSLGAGSETQKEPEPVQEENKTPNLMKDLSDPGKPPKAPGSIKTLPGVPKPSLGKTPPKPAPLSSKPAALGKKSTSKPLAKEAIEEDDTEEENDGKPIKEEKKVKTLPASKIIPSDYAIKIAINEAYEREISDYWGGMAPFEAVGSMNDNETKEFVLELLKEVRKRGASDLHISSLSYPFVRRNGFIETISDHIVTPDEAFKLNTVLLKKRQYASFEENKDLNYALQIDASNRFRVSLMVHKDGAAGSYRLVPEEILSLEDLGFSDKDTATIERFLDYHNGLVLVTGAIGSGKTTTLASMVNVINKKRHDHVITVEDPIEIVQYSECCNVTQREIQAHTSSYHAALKGALREDPDIIVIGELHDLETIEMAITASETGHLVIGTLHTCDATNTLNRLLDVFPPTQQPQIRAMTAGSLRGIVCQKLLPTVDGSMTVAPEILVNNMAVGNIISDGRTHHLRAVLQTGQSAGMVTMDASVLDLYQRGVISRETADRNIRSSDVKQEFKRVVAIEEAKKLSGN